VLNRRLHNDEFNDLFSPSNIIRVITSRVMRWTEHVARKGEERCIKDFVGKLEEKSLGGVRMILKWMLKKWDGVHVLD